MFVAVIISLLCNVRQMYLHAVWAARRQAIACPPGVFQLFAQTELLVGREWSCLRHRDTRIRNLEMEGEIKERTTLEKE